MKNGWTGGQYSVYRAIFGAYLLQHFLFLVPWAGELASSQGLLADKTASPLIFLFPNFLALIDTPAAATLLAATGVLFSISFLIGWKDRWAAIGIWYIWACFFGRNPLISNPSLPYVGWLLLAHAAMPSAPFGSVEASGRPDADGGWRIDDGIVLAAWTVMAVGYSYSGYAKLCSPSWLDGSALERVLDNPLARPTLLPELMRSLPEGTLMGATWAALAGELFFAPLALSARLRPFLWLAMLGMHLAVMLLLDFADLSFGMVILHLFTFDPAWIPGEEFEESDLLFYDGGCGLCHRFVRFALAEDRSGKAFRFAALGGPTFFDRISRTEREHVPGSIIVLTADGTLLTRSAAVARLLVRFGGMWRLIGISLGLPPCGVTDACYDAVASIRYRLFGKKDGPCPLLSPALRARFVD